MNTREALRTIQEQEDGLRRGIQKMLLEVSDQASWWLDRQDPQVDLFKIAPEEFDAWSAEIRTRMSDSIEELIDFEYWRMFRRANITGLVDDLKGYSYPKGLLNILINHLDRIPETAYSFGPRHMSKPPRYAFFRNRVPRQLFKEDLDRQIQHARTLQQIVEDRTKAELRLPPPLIDGYLSEWRREGCGLLSCIQAIAGSPDSDADPAHDFRGIVTGWEVFNHSDISDQAALISAYVTLGNDYLMTIKETMANFSDPPESIGQQYLQQFYGPVNQAAMRIANVDSTISTNHATG